MKRQLESTEATCAGGQTKVGEVVSDTVTRKVQVAEFPAKSVAVQVTVNEPGASNVTGALMSIFAGSREIEQIVNIIHFNAMC